MPVSKITGLEQRDDEKTVQLVKINELVDSVNGAGAELTLTTYLAPAALPSGTTDNWNPGTGATVIRVTTGVGMSTLTGIVAPADAAGHIRILLNAGPGILALKHDDSGSSAANRFWLASPVIHLTDRSGGIIIYDTVEAKWRFVG